MQKKILLAIDDSMNAKQAVQYALRMGTAIPELHFILLNVQPALSQYLTEEARRKPKARKALEKAIRENEAAARELLENTAQRMIRGGLNDARIERRSVPMDTSVAKDILALGQAESLDAIMVGRSGTSYLKEWVMGSVTANLVEHSKVIPIWVVDGEVNNDGVLLAADGSSTSLRALDHMAFMLSAAEDKPIHLLHVQPRFKDYCQIDLEADTVKGTEEVLLDDDQKCMDDFYSQALAILEKNGIAQERLILETLGGRLSVAQAILEYAREKEVGTIVMGKSGRSNQKFFGSVSRGLIQKAGDAALWVVP